MVGQAYINNVDISTYGAVLVRGAYEALLTPASTKDIISNESRLLHGKQIVSNATNMKLSSRNLAITVLIEGSTQAEYLTNYKNFLNAVTQGEFAFKVPKLSTVYHFVYTDCSKYGDYGLKRGKFTLKLLEANPNNRQTIQ